MKLNTAGIILSILMSSAAFANDSNYEKALTAYQEKEIETAYIHLKNALKDNPNSLHAKLLFANVLIEKKLYTEAELELIEALDMGADVNLVVEPLTNVLLHKGQYARLLSLFDNDSLNYQANYQYLLAKGRAQIGLEDYEGALASYQNMSKQYPGDSEVQLGLVSVYFSTGQLERAEQILSSLKPQAPNNEKISRYLGTLAFELGDLQSALTYYRQANRLASDNVQSIRGLVNTYMSLQQYEEAKQWVEKLISLAPHDPQARLLNSMVLMQTDEEEEANELLKNLTEQLSTVDQTFMLSQPQLLLIDAMASYGQKNWEQARKKFRLYIKQSQDDLDIRAVVLLADVYNALNQPQMALELLARYESELIKHKDYALLLAGAYIQYNKKFDADNLLTRLRGLYGSDPGVLLMSAHLLNSRGSAEQAIEMLTRADIPENDNYKHTLAALYLNAGDYSESLALSSELADNNPGNTKYRLLEIKSQIGAGLIDEAEKNIRGLYQTHKDQPEVQFEYARLLFNKGKADKARSELEQLIHNYPDNGLYRLTLAEVEYSLGQVTSAVGHLRKLTNKSGFKLRALHKLALIYLQHNQFDQSLDAVNQILRQEPIDLDAMYIKARSLAGLNRVEAARNQCDKLYAWWLEDAPNLLKLSKLQLQLDLPDDALKSLSRALELEPEHPGVLTALIKLNIQQNKFADASTLIRNMEKADRYNNNRLMILKGDLEQAKGNISKAFNYYSQVLEQDNSDVVAFMSLYGLARYDGYSQRFADIAEELVKRFPDKLFYRTKLADHLMWMESRERARYHYQILLTKKLPKSEMALALNNLAVINIDSGNLEQAVQMSQQAVELYPAIPSLLDTAGWALTKSGQLQGGLEYLRQAYSMNASDPEVLYHLTYTLVELNKMAEAKMMLNRLKALPDDNKYRIKAEALIKQQE